MMNKIIILNGPNLNLLGEREKDKYGNISLKNIENICKEFSKKNNIDLSLYQSNIEGELVEEIQKSRKNQDGLIINAGGYTHTSVAIHDALKILKIPIIELHITNIYNREDFRHKSLISKIAKGVICGFGTEGLYYGIKSNENLFKKMKIDKKLIKELVDHLNEFNLTELEYQEGQTKIKVSKVSRGIEKINSSSIVSPNKAVLTETEDSGGTRIKSPIIGTAYLAPEPGGKKFVKVGDKIKKGQTVMIVEAMKTMNHVPSTSDGEVKKILLNDGQPVEFGQPLIVLK